MTQKTHWIDRIVEDLERRGDGRVVFSTAKTPSGPIHVGVGRELVYCSILERLLREKGYDTEFLFFVDDFDSIKSFPPNIPKEFAAHKEYLGMPMYKVPCPYNHCESWGQHYAQQLIETFPAFGFKPKVVWSRNLYRTGEMKNLLRTALQRVGELRQILREVVGPTLKGEKLESFHRDMQQWYPCLVVCERCGRLKTARVTSYDPGSDVVTYHCAACKNRGGVKVEEWPVKLRWRVDWPAKWAIFRVSCEPAGKDHCVKGGAYDTGQEIVRRVYGQREPYRIPYEWVLLGERAMKTHKGISFTFDEWLAVAPPETYRYMVLRDEPRKHISFAPERIPQLIDEFERAERIYFNVEKAASLEEENNFKRVYPLCMPEGTPETMPTRLPYRFAVILSQLTPLLGEEKVMSKSISVLRSLYAKMDLDEKEITSIRDRLGKGRYWVTHYAPEELKIQITPSVTPIVKEKLEFKQKEALKAMLEMLKKNEWDENTLQYEIFELGKRLGIGTGIFEAVYLIFLGKRFGPRLAPFLLSLEKDFILKRIQEALN